MNYSERSLLLILASTILFLFYLTFWVNQYLRLRKIPGPALAAFTNFWLFSKLWRNESWRVQSVKLHKTYGPIVRYGPNRIMFSDPSAIGTIFSTSNLLEKAESYDPMVDVLDGRELPTMIAVRPEKRHTAIKRALGTMFTAKSMSEYETHVEETLESLTEKLRDVGPQTDISEWVTYFAFDTLMKIAFDEDLGFMTHRKDIDNVMQAAVLRVGHWRQWLAVPWLEHLLFKNKILLFIKEKILNRPAQRSSLFLLATKKIQGRRAKNQEDGKQVLVDKIFAASESYPEVVDKHMVVGLSVTLLNAGGHTTAVTISNVLLNLLRNPEKLAALRNELELSSLPTPMKFVELNKLPYLDAVIRETLRFTPTSQFMIERVTPPGGVDIAGTWIPGGTIVSVSHHCSNRDPSIWGDDANVFNPDRWTEAEHSQRQLMERAFVAFSAGKRICTGQHIAWLEMKKALPILVQNFEMSLVDPTSDRLKVHIRPKSDIRKVPV